MIYFAQATDGGTIKIGCSVNVPTRLKQLESHYGRPLALLATLPGGKAEEEAIHARFAVHRLGRTEQFRPVAEIMAFIGRPLLVSPDPDVVEMMDEVERDGTRTESIRIRMTPDFKAWMEGVAAHERLTVAALIERALVDTARKNGHPKAPPAR